MLRIWIYAVGGVASGSSVYPIPTYYRIGENEIELLGLTLGVGDPCVGLHFLKTTASPSFRKVFKHRHTNKVRGTGTLALLPAVYRTGSLTRSLNFSFRTRKLRKVPPVLYGKPQVYDP